MAKTETPDDRRARLAAEVTASDLETLGQIAAAARIARDKVAEATTLAGQVIDHEAASRLTTLRAGSISNHVGALLDQVIQGAEAGVATIEARGKGEG